MVRQPVLFVRPFFVADPDRTKLRPTSSNTRERQLFMFETAVQEKRTGALWSIMIGCAALALLLGAGYILIA
jgi:hypothetical protein